MDHIMKLFEALSAKLDVLAKGNAVVAKPVSIGERHVVPLVELNLGFGGAGGTGEGSDEEESPMKGEGTGGGAGGGAKATPVAVIVIDGGDVRVESLSK